MQVAATPLPELPLLPLVPLLPPSPPNVPDVPDDIPEVPPELAPSPKLLLVLLPQAAKVSALAPTAQARTTAR